MRSTILAAIFAIVSIFPATANAAEDWRYVGSDTGDYLWLVDVNSFREDGEFLYAWTLATLPASSTKVYYPARRLLKIDCADNQYLTVQRVAYELNTGKVHETKNWPDGPGRDGLTTPSPGQIMEKVVAFACMFDG